MRPNRPLAAAALLLALLMLFSPLSETFLALWPLRWGETAWRVGAAVLLGRGLTTVMMALLLAGGAVLLLGGRLSLSVLSVAAGCLGLVLFALAGLFVLDSVQVRGQVQPQLRGEFDGTTLQTLVRLGLSSLVALLLAAGGWKAARAGAAQESRERNRKEAAPVLITGAVREGQA